MLDGQRVCENPLQMGDVHLPCPGLITRVSNLDMQAPVAKWVRTLAKMSTVLWMIYGLHSSITSVLQIFIGIDFVHPSIWVMFTILLAINWDAPTCR